ncbi:hypothetical protein ACFXPA_02955 [Amycolatopsis sp. NPDC059090]|uniref:hypothetical protein n=1 Tax=unclassified Amycolatopsis TaxID=2618356 RepID=UPI003672ED50
MSSGLSSAAAAGGCWASRAVVARTTGCGISAADAEDGYTADADDGDADADAEDGDADAEDGDADAGDGDGDGDGDGTGSCGDDGGELSGGGLSGGELSGGELSWDELSWDGLSWDGLSGEGLSGDELSREPDWLLASRSGRGKGEGVEPGALRLARESAGRAEAATAEKGRVVVMPPWSSTGRPEPAFRWQLSTGGHSCGQPRAGRRLPAGAGLVAGSRINPAVHSLG